MLLMSVCYDSAMLIQQHAWTICKDQTLESKFKLFSNPALQYTTTHLISSFRGQPQPYLILSLISAILEKVCVCIYWALLLIWKKEKHTWNWAVWLLNAAVSILCNKTLTHACKHSRERRAKSWLTCCLTYAFSFFFSPCSVTRPGLGLECREGGSVSRAGRVLGPSGQGRRWGCSRAPAVSQSE